MATVGVKFKELTPLRLSAQIGSNYPQCRKPPRHPELRGGGRQMLQDHKEPQWAQGVYSIEKEIELQMEKWIFCSKI